MHDTTGTTDRLPYIVENWAGTRAFAPEAFASFEEARARIDAYADSVATDEHEGDGIREDLYAVSVGLPVTADTLDGAVDWDQPFRVIDSDGGGVYLGVEGVHAPELGLPVDDDGSLVEGWAAELGDAVARQGWETVGRSGQQGGGALMHSSEYLGGGLADDVLGTPGVYVITAVECYGENEDAADNGDPAGWLILRKLDAADVTA